MAQNHSTVAFLLALVFLSGAAGRGGANRVQMTWSEPHEYAEDAAEVEGSHHHQQGFRISAGTGFDAFANGGEWYW